MSNPLDGAVKAREETAPNTEVTTQDRGAGFDGGEGPDATFAVGGVAEAFDGVPEGAADSLGWRLEKCGWIGGKGERDLRPCKRRRRSRMLLPRGKGLVCDPWWLMEMGWGEKGGRGGGWFLGAARSLIS